MKFKSIGIAAAIALALTAGVHADDASAYQPGGRVLLDAHNCYPHQGRWRDRIDRALSTGVPIAIEQDLDWYRNPDTGEYRSIVSHGEPYTGNEPSLETYFFEAIRPTVQYAFQRGNTGNWPLITLNLDLKNNSIEHCRAVWQTLANYQPWLTTAPKTADITQVMPLSVKPLLVLTAGAGNQFTVFYNVVPEGERLLLFGAARHYPMQIDSLSRPEQIAYRATVTPARLVYQPADNFRRWWNDSWYVVEPGGPTRAGAWTAYDAQRLQAIVEYAHRLGYWIRFYTLNGYETDPGMGWSSGYNFGARDAVQQRWRAAIDVGVDFVATDMYEAFAEFKARMSQEP